MRLSGHGLRWQGGKKRKRGGRFSRPKHGRRVFLSGGGHICSLWLFYGTKGNLVQLKGGTGGLSHLLGFSRSPTVRTCSVPRGVMQLLWVVYRLRQQKHPHLWCVGCFFELRHVVPSPRLTWKLPGPLWKTWFHLQRPSGSFHVSLRECNPNMLLTRSPSSSENVYLHMLLGKGIHDLTRVACTFFCVGQREKVGVQWRVQIKIGDPPK